MEEATWLSNGTYAYASVWKTWYRIRINVLSLQNFSVRSSHYARFRTWQHVALYTLGMARIRSLLHARDIIITSFQPPLVV